jgi:hypothetical protein
VDNILMTPAAGSLSHTPAAILDLDRLMKFTGGKGQ